MPKMTLAKDAPKRRVRHGIHSYAAEPGESIDVHEHDVELMETLGFSIDLDSMTVEALREYAGDLGIVTTSKSTKPEITKAITEARAASAAEESAGNGASEA